MRRRPKAMIAPATMPTPMPPSTLTTKSPLASARLNVPATTAATANL